MGSGMTIDYRTDYRTERNTLAKFVDCCNIVHTSSLDLSVRKV